MTKDKELWEATPLVDIFFYEGGIDLDTVKTTDDLTGIYESGWYYMLRWEGFDDAETTPCGPYDTEEDAYAAGNAGWANDEHMPGKHQIH